MLEYPKTRGTDKVKLHEMSESEMDNQQERLVACARLAMLIDTEGTATIRVLQRAKERNGNMVPILEAVNTSKPLMEWMHSTLASLGVPSYFFTFDPRRFNPRCSRVQHRVTIQGMKRVEKAIPFLLPFMIVKKGQMELIAEFIEHRRSVPKNTCYSDRDYEIANQVRALNDNKSGAWRPVSSETVRQAREMQQHLAVKIQSALTGDCERSAETTDPTVQ